MSNNPLQPMPEKIVERKVIVYKTQVDSTIVKLAAEKVKDRVFRRFGFLKPPADQIRQVSFEKDYEPFFVVEGKYTIDYYRGRTYTIPIDGNAQEIILLNQTLKPEPTKEWRQNKTIKIEGEERLIHEGKAYLVLDVNGREVSPKRVPSAPQEEHPKKILAEYESARKLDFAPNKEIEALKSKIARRPREIKRIVNELFEVSDRAVIFIPIYRIRFQNTKTGEQKTVKFDGGTAQIIR
ncbi:MAG: hypothetical protein OEZ35_06985 [Candidatus Bathyarchaeota archaeon]|nr:hypothetical protein [Candidatus Bathyarchaeota archaeon]